MNQKEILLSDMEQEREMLAHDGQIDGQLMAEFVNCVFDFIKNGTLSDEQLNQLKRSRYLISKSCDVYQQYLLNHIKEDAELAVKRVLLDSLASKKRSIDEEM